MVSCVRLGKCSEDREETERKKEIQNASLLGCLVAALAPLLGWAGWCGLRWILCWAGLGCEGLGWALLLAAHPVNWKSRGQMLIRSTSFGKVKITKGYKMYSVNLTSSSLLDCCWDPPGSAYTSSFANEAKSRHQNNYLQLIKFQRVQRAKS